MGLFGGQPPCFGFSLGFRKRLEIGHWQNERLSRGNALKRLPIYNPKGGAQDLMTPENFGQALFQCNDVERTGQPYCSGHVVGD